MRRRDPTKGLRRFMSHQQWVAKVTAERMAKHPTLADPGRRALTILRVGDTEDSDSLIDIDNRFAEV